MARYTTFADLHLILRRDGRILLGQRINTGFADGSYSLPAGHLERGESATDGVVREALEEIGVRVGPIDLRLVHTMHHHTDSGRLALFFETHVWDGEIANREPDKCSGWNWYDEDRLPEPMVPYIAEALQHVHAGIAYSERGWTETERAVTIHPPGEAGS